MKRRNDIDLLRILATYLLFVFHSAKVFDYPPYYHIKNGVLSDELGVLAGFIHLWHMPLFFLLAGWSARNSLLSRGGRKFIIERVKRIFIPFLFGLWAICIPVRYIEKVLIGGADFSPLQFVEVFWTDLDYFSWCHLWFLIYLFTFTLLYLPLFRRLEKINSDKRIGPGAVYSVILAPVAIQLLLRARWPGWQNLINDWANFTYYSTYFILGFIWAKFPAVDAVIGRTYKRAGIAGLALIGLFRLIEVYVGFDQVGWYTQYYLLGTASAYLMIIGMIGYARRAIGGGGDITKFLAESSLPVYILHQIFVVGAAYILLYRDWPIAIKFTLVVIGSTIGCLACYLLLVRSNWIMRFFFGMRPAPGRSRP